MRVVIAAGSGQVGHILARHFHLGGHAVTVLSRHEAMPGTQFVSWIHEADFTGAVDQPIANENFEGTVNVASPNPIPNRKFLRVLREAWGTRIGSPILPWILETGTFLMRTESELLLKSRRVVPSRLLESGFKFQFPEWSEAARDLVDRWRQTAR